jgi:hypothetical protein
MYTLVSTRFNNDTWRENGEYRLKYNYKCIYSDQQKMSPKILEDSLVFVIEMNNDKNQIEGIGLIKNKPIFDRYYKIYDIGNFNRYTFKSNYYLSREELLQYNQILVQMFDYILFKEKTHMKRGAGYTTIPEKLLNHKKCEKINLKQEIKNIFLLVFRNIPLEKV